VSNPWALQIYERGLVYYTTTASHGFHDDVPALVIGIVMYSLLPNAAVPCFKVVYGDVVNDTIPAAVEQGYSGFLGGMPAEDKK